MKTNDLMIILRRLLVGIVLFFILFIVVFNIFKFMDFVIKIDRVLSEAEQNDTDIPAINTDFNELEGEKNNKFNAFEAHTADEMGYVDWLEVLNGPEWKNGINIMFVGSDKKTYRDGKARSDVIIIFRITKSGKILSLSIPRDTLIEISDGPWAGKKDKIGHSLYWEGMDNLKGSVERLLGSPIYKVAVVDNFRSFEAFLSIIGGLETDKYLQGELGIKWIRNRQFKLGDIERCKRQELFLKKAMVKVWRITKQCNYIYANFMYNAFKRLVQSDITKDEFLKIIYYLKNNGFEPDRDFYTGVLPGHFEKYDSVVLNHKGLDCWVVDDPFIEKLRYLFYSEEDTYKYFLQSKADLWSFVKIDLKFPDRNVNK
jgi:anionic cell wall polymer biosynthesis LytR-Cps2A-Psr (LCP) family protein